MTNATSERVSGVAHDVLPQRAKKKPRRDTAMTERTASTSSAAEADPTPLTTDDEDVRRGFESTDARVVRYAPEHDDFRAREDEDEDDMRAREDEDEDDTRARRGVQYAYKDHTADIQIHAWGCDLAEAYAWAALAMFDYMTPLEDCARVRTTRFKEIRASGHDLDTLLFAFLDELLFTFHTEMLICTAVQVCEFNRDEWSIRAVVGGTTFVDGETRQGTEIKAITYSAMKIIERGEISKDDESTGVHRAELFVIVDI